MSLYEGAKTRVRVDSELSEEFDVKVGMHKGSVPSTFILAVVVDVVTGRKGELSELLYADDLVLKCETIMGPRNKFLKWKEAPKSKGVKVKLGRLSLCYTPHIALTNRSIVSNPTSTSCSFPTLSCTTCIALTRDLSVFKILIPCSHGHSNKGLLVLHSCCRQPLQPWRKPSSHIISPHSQNEIRRHLPPTPPHNLIALTLSPR